jgi:excinuclease UvrABC helicase subunit UvrB
MIAQGYGRSTGLVTFGMWTKSLEDQIEDILEEIRSPLDLARLQLIEKLLINLHIAMVSTLATKKELSDVVNIYQPRTDDLRARIEALEKETEELRLQAGIESSIIEAQD